MKAKKQEILYVQICEAKPNRMFTKKQTDSIRFLRYNQPVVCAECGKKKKTLWTMLAQFLAKTMEGNGLSGGEKSHTPLTPVCPDHLLEPDFKNQGE